MTYTPRTGTKIRKGIDFIADDVVPADFARTLERELAAVMKDRDDWKATANQIDLEAGRIIAERDQLRADLYKARARLAEAEVDTERIDWLEAHPLPTQIHGGHDDGAEGKAWAIIAHGCLTLREVVDKARK